jgi:hypothetical protein
VSWRPAVCALALLAGCGSEPARLDPTCLAGVDVYLDALEAAPQPVRLQTGTTIADCASAARSDGELQEAGLLMVQAADRLALAAEDGDAVAAGRLGYLAGAVERGSARTQGVQAELARRIVRAGAVLGDPAPEVERAYLEGLEAGRRTG